MFVSRHIPSSLVSVLCRASSHVRCVSLIDRSRAVHLCLKKMNYDATKICISVNCLDLWLLYVETQDLSITCDRILLWHFWFCSLFALKLHAKFRETRDNFLQWKVAAVVVEQRCRDWNQHLVGFYLKSAIKTFLSSRFGYNMGLSCV